MSAFPATDPFVSPPTLAADDLGALGDAILHTLVGQAQVGLAVFDRERRFILVNARFAALQGASPAGYQNRRLEEGGLCPCLGDSAGLALTRALDGETVSLDVPASTMPSLSGRFCSQDWFPVRDRTNAIVGAGVIVRDTTQQVVAGRALAEAYAHLQTLIDTLPVGIAIYDRDLRVARMNRYALNRGEFDATAVIGTPVSELFPELWAVTQHDFARALRGESFTTELDRRAGGTPNGPAYLSLAYAPVRIDGMVDGVIVCALDESERMASTRQLQAAYAQLQAVFDNVPVAIAVYDDNLQLERMNDQMSAWTGIEYTAAQHRHVSAIIPPLWTTVEPYYARALAGEACAAELDRRALGEDRGPASVTVSYRPILSEGKVIGVTVTATDITERIDRERALEADARLREDILHIASHELRTPLTTILGFAEHLARAASTIDQPGREAIDLIHDESERMARMLDQFTGLISLSSATEETECEPVALGPLAQRQVRLLLERHPRMHIDAESTGAPIVESNSDSIAEIISNLLENAAKYAGEEAHVVVRVHTENDPMTAAVEVVDDGPGIPIEEQAAVFERRYRGRNSGGAHGLGLGLYVSRVMATRLGGSLTVESAPGRGAAFVLRLPLTAGTG